MLLGKRRLPGKRMVPGKRMLSKECCQKNVVGQENNIYLAKASRILHPPDKLLVGACCISAVNDRPFNIL